MACDVKALLSEANCFNCYGPSIWPLLELALLCQIAEAGGTGGGGSGSVQVLQDATGAPPPDPTKAALSYPTGGGGVSEWDVASQTWI